MDVNTLLYKKLYLIRRCEQRIIDDYGDDAMKTPMHMSMGAEAISAGVCLALGDNAQVFGTYRSHALYLAKTGNSDDFFAEIYGRGSALLQGKGGSMHLCAPSKGVMGTSAIVASIIPVAVGAEFANKYANSNKKTAVFFGDGAIDEGVFWESLNVACLMKLPILFVCEDNGFAVHTPSASRCGYDKITNIVSQFNCVVLSSDSTDAEVIYKLTLEAIKLSNEKQLPCFLHLKYYRYLEHVGVNEDFDAGYRKREDFESWQKRDPILLQRKKITAPELIEKEIDIQVEESIKKSKQSPFPSDDILLKEVV
ncbi:MAG: thiamine pyrophosphate-dependent dehydrogenase E1 component subunit alpha [Candidatus Omnitrophica bacterium]|nr:thiamine pyrophosphate-dependent dehydrogenase E1 component subunit alpha [Candidatus Omnitrophota bacterium]